MTNLLGISGHIGAGKDEVTRIIQYLTSKNPHITQDYITLRKRWETDKFDWNLLGDWKNKKFADGLKDIVCILIGCTREQLEDRDFKNSYLGEEWTKIIMSDGWIPSYNNPDNHSLEQSAEPMEYRYTVRKVLQYVGTDLLRNQFHPDVHVNMLFSKYKSDILYTKQTIGNNPIIGSIDHEYKQYGFPMWIISDVRFPNEAEAIKKRGGVNIRVRRETERDRFARNDKPEERSKYYHPSETALDNYQFDWIIDNDSSIEDLVNAVRDILKAERII